MIRYSYYVYPGLKYAPNGEPPPMEAILAHVCIHYKVMRDEVKSRVRTARIVLPRHTTMYLQRKLHYKTSLNEIARWWGEGIHHSTVISACKAVQDKIDSEPKYKKLIQEMEDKLRNRQTQTVGDKHP